MDPLHDILPIVRLESVDSTNLLARREIESGELAPPVGRFYIAREQTDGLGRHGREWHSPPGGLWCSMAWPLLAGAEHHPHAILNGLGLRVGVVCLKVIGETLTRSASRFAPMLKWPNDVLINRRKVCGSLCEVVHGPGGAGGQSVLWAVVGVGINVNNDVGTLPSDLRRAPVALRDCVEGRRDVDIDELAMRLRAGLHHAVTIAGVDPETLSVARERLYGGGTGISVMAQGGLLMPGTLVGLSDAGLPIIRTGEVEFVAPPGSELF